MGLIIAFGIGVGRFAPVDVWYAQARDWVTAKFV